MSIWRYVDLVTPMAVRVAATLHVADHLAAGATVDEMARAETCDRDALERLLRHLAVVGVVARREDGSFTLTEMGDELRDDHPGGARGLLAIDGAIGRAELAFVELLHSVRTGEAAYARLHGRGFWDDMAADPERQARYDREMGADVAVWARELVDVYDWASLGDLVDVGGGNGTFLVALLEAYQTLRGTVFDRPATAAAARATIERAGLADRADAVDGDFFVEVPAGRAAYVLCAVLHDWSDTEALAILEQVRRAAPPESRVLVIEKTGAPGAQASTSMDLRVLVYFGGRERVADDLVAMGERAGLRLVEVHTAGDLSVVELVPA